jgi:hypothetical protein
MSLPVKNSRPQRCRWWYRGQMTRYAPLAPRNIWTIPKCKIAIHNHTEHHAGQKSGVNGFRVWFDNPHHDCVECSCGWRPDLGSHYQMRTRYEPRE